MTEKEIELSMDKALKKLPFEIKKIKFVLAVIKFFKRKQSMDMIKLISVNNDKLKNEALNVYLENNYYFSKISDNILVKYQIILLVFLMLRKIQRLSLMEFRKIRRIIG